MHPQSLAVRYRFKAAKEPEADRSRSFFCGLPIAAVIKNGAEPKLIKTPSERMPLMAFDQRSCQRYKAVPESDYADDD